MAISIQQLIQGQPTLVTVDVNDSLRRALRLMIENEFSQLPVLENGKPYRDGSLITSDSIVRALRFFGSSLGDLHVRDAIEAARLVGADDDVFSKIGALSDNDAHLVIDDGKNLVGIVTNYDTAHFFHHRAVDMLLAENIETTLKSYLREAYGCAGGDEASQHAVNNLTTHQAKNREDCRKALMNYGGRCGVRPDEEKLKAALDENFPESTEDGDFDKLTLDQYVALARTDEAWSVLGRIFGVSKELFATMMEGARKTRNKLAHDGGEVVAVAPNPPESKEARVGDETAPGDPVNPIDTPIQPTGEEAVSAEEPTPTDEEVALIEEEETSDEVVAESVEAKYAPLAHFLVKQPRKLERLPLSFEAIESIIGATLPDTARENRSWWDNNPQSRVQSSQWLKVNWRVVSVNMTAQKVTFGRAHERAKTYIAFFSQVQMLLKQHPQFPLLAANPLGINWLPLHKFECRHPLKPSIVLSFSHHHRLRLELYLDCGDTDLNRNIYRQLQEQASSIEEAFGAKLLWEPLEGKRACRIAIYTSGAIDDSAEAKEKLTGWAVQNTIRFYNAFRDPLQTALDS